MVNKRYTFTPRPADVPEGWQIWNAPRPLYGHKEWKGDFLSGIFYAAIDPAGERAEWYTERNIDLDGKLLVYVDEEKAIDEAVEFYRLEFGREVDRKEYRRELLQGWLQMQKRANA